MSATAERSYSSMDKGEWGPGPWDAEPDKVQWTDEATGLPCLAVRNRLGAWCGYAGVTEGHPWFGRDYSDGEWDDDSRPDGIIDVHGGLTYSDFCQEDTPEDSGICHVPTPGEPHRVYWFGFDCAHSMDLAPGMLARERKMGFPPPPADPGSAYRDLAYVRTEVASLARQLAAVAT